MKQIHFYRILIIMSTLLTQCTTYTPMKTASVSSATKFVYSASEITQICQAQRAELRRAVAAIEAIDSNQVTLQNSLLALETARAEFSDRTAVPIFMAYVSVDADARKTAQKCEVDIAKEFVDLFTREKLFAVLKSLEKKNSVTDPADQRLLEDYLITFKSNGLELLLKGKKAEFEKFKALKTQLVQIESDYAAALNNWKETVEVSRQELEGMPQTFIDEVTVKDEKGNPILKDGKPQYRLQLSYPHVTPFMESAKSAAARKRLDRKFYQRGGQANVERIEQAIGIRYEMAKLLGYDTYADYVLERKMAKTKDNVLNFISDLKSRLKPQGEENLKQLIAAKREELKDPSVSEVHAWEWKYYENYIKKNLGLDNEEIRKYFPNDIVVKGMYEIYETLLGVKFVKDTRFEVWAPDVELYRVEDGGKTIAYFFMDMYPRPAQGKYGHAAAWNLIAGRELSDGTYSAPISAMVCNFAKPAKPGERALWSHREVETLFHEFGHIMHGVLTRAKYGSLAGTSVKGDFVEAPSQMLENWVWEKQGLEKLSGHYQDTSKKLPEDLLQKLLSAKKVNLGIFYLRQLSFASLDMEYHTLKKTQAELAKDKGFTTKIYSDATKNIMLIPIQEGTIPQASFGHLMGGYDSGYYGYLWSEVFAQDMFTRFADGKLLSSKEGASYRKWVLEMGNMIEPMEILRGFLGREPNNTAFLESLK